MSAEDASVGSLDSLGAKTNLVSHMLIYLKIKSKWKPQQHTGKILKGPELEKHLLLLHLIELDGLECL